MPQTRLKDFNNERIGMGFNSQTGEAIGTALDVTDISADKVAPGSVFESEISIVRTHEELQRQLGMEFEGEGRYGLFAASAKAKFAEKTNYNSESTFVVARNVVSNSMVRGGNYRLKPEAEALIKSTPPRLEEFKTAYGDMFVRGLLTGGEFYCVIRITSISTVKQDELALAAHAEFTNPAAGGSFTAKYTQANLNASTKSEYSAIMYQRGGVGKQGASIVTIEEALQRYKAFAEIAYNSPVGYVTELANYNTLPLPVPPIEEQENYLIALRDVREKKLKYLQKNNDFVFAYDHPEFFEDPPAPEILLETATVYRKLASAAMDYATKLARGEIKTPALFIPPINEPTIKLKRVKPPAFGTVTVPNLIGMAPYEADALLRERGLIPKHNVIGVLPSPTVKQRIVLKQSPDPGMEVQIGSDVQITYNRILGGPAHRPIIPSAYKGISCKPPLKLIYPE